MAIANLAIKSFRNRKLTVLLTVFSIALSVALLIAIEKVRVQAKDSFTNTISGTDLIVGARTSSVNLLLSSVFQMGSATNGIKYESYEEIIDNDMVAWSIPFSLGDTHKGYRVIGTSADYFEHYKYGIKQSLETVKGHWFKSDTDVVIGNEVARKLGYVVGDNIIISHGAGDSYIDHDEHPLTISGILNPTSTPIDRSLFMSLEGVEDLHVEQKIMAQGYDPFLSVDLEKQPTAQNPKSQSQAHIQDEAEHKEHDSHEHEEHDSHDHDSHAHDKHESHGHDEQHSDEHEHGTQSYDSHDHANHVHSADVITGFYLGLHQRPQALSMLPIVNKYEAEALMAVMPGVALLELWSMLSVVEQTLFAISMLVVIISLASMLIILLNSLNQRRREMSILRAIGARPSHIFSLMMGEAFVIISAGLICGVGFLYGILFAVKPFILEHFGVYLSVNAPSSQELFLMALVGIAGMLISLFPSVQIYRYALSDGMSVKS